MSVGTPQYMSPEQIKAKRIDGRSDIYSLGIVFYEMLTGKLPYNADDVITLVLKHTGDPIPQLPKRLKQFQPLLEKMVAKKPAERVKNAEGLIRLIDSIKHDLRVKTEHIKLPAPPTNRGSSGKWLKRLLTASVLVCLAGASFYFITESNKNRELTAWGQALEINSIAAYNFYLEKYPQGKHSQEAHRAVLEVKINQNFDKHLKRARNFYMQDLYDKAMRELREAQKIKSDQPELLELQIKITSAMDLIQENEFNDNISRAQQYFDSGDLETANEFLQRAKKIKRSDQLTLLEQKITEGLKEGASEPAEPDKDPKHIK